MFRKNSMEFFVGLQPYLYYYYSGCTLEFHGHMSFPECSMVTWPCHVTWLTKTLSCLCLCSVVLLWRLLGWVFPCMGSLFLLEVLITFLFNFCTLLIQLLHGLCTTFPYSSCDLSCDITLTYDMWYFPTLLPCVVSPNVKRKEKKYK